MPVPIGTQDTWHRVTSETVSGRCDSTALNHEPFFGLARSVSVREDRRLRVEIICDLSKYACSGILVSDMVSKLCHFALECSQRHGGW